jgi:hypothetical protein
MDAVRRGRRSRATQQGPERAMRAVERPGRRTPPALAVRRANSLPPLRATRTVECAKGRYRSLPGYALPMAASASRRVPQRA